MPFNPTDKDSFTKGFTPNRAFDKITFRNGRLILGETTILGLKVKGPIDTFFYRTPEAITRVLSSASSSMTSTETYNGIVTYTPGQATELSVFANGTFMYNKSTEKKGYTIKQGDCFNFTIVNLSQVNGRHIKLVDGSQAGITIVGDPYIYPFIADDNIETNGVGTFQVRCTSATDKTFKITRIG